VLRDYPLVHAVMRMNEAKVRQVVVVEQMNGQRLLGLLTMTDILRAASQCRRECRGFAL